MQAAKVIGKIRPIHTKIKTAEGFEAEDDLIYCGVSNSVSVAGSIKIKRREVGLNDGRFELIMIQYPRDVAQFANTIVKALARDFNYDYLRMLHTSRAEFEFDEPIPWTIDGEYAGEHTKVVIENVHNAVQIFRR
ncbi:MAG: hypothetical protein LBG83_02730 [Oscillospiraceae bacterium]|nr:hypothetical protein [Oscillospiraceae bacterium]